MSPAAPAAAAVVAPAAAGDDEQVEGEVAQEGGGGAVWTRKQLEALRAHREGRSIAMLGCAGTGKTKVLFEMLKTEKWGKAVIVCANNVRLPCENGWCTVQREGARADAPA
jgi:hypothetical protein